MTSALPDKSHLSEVSIVKFDNLLKLKDFNSPKRYEIVKKAVEMTLAKIGGIKAVLNSNVALALVKPNLVVSTPPELNLTTDPHVTASIAELLLDSGVKRVVVAEYPALIHKGRDAFEVTLTKKFVEDVGAEVVYLDESELVEVEVKEAEVHRLMKIPKIVMDADLILNVPKMKTHWLTKVTLGIKNLLGLLPSEEKLKYHREDIHQKLVDILACLKDKLKLTIIDGIVAMEGLGPRCGDLVPMGLLVASRDVVAADAVASYIMGFDPMEIQEIRIAHRRGLGNGDLREIVCKGSDPGEVRRHFKRASLDLVHVYENVQIYIGGACKACIGFTKAALEALAREGKLKEKLTIILGKDPPIPEFPQGKIIFVGDCVKDYAETYSGEAYFIEGCPPFRIYWKLPEILRVSTPLVLDGIHKK